MILPHGSEASTLMDASRAADPVVTLVQTTNQFAQAPHGAVDGSTAHKPQVARMKLRDGASNNAKGWILFWLLGYPIAVVVFIALSHLNCSSVPQTVEPGFRQELRVLPPLVESLRTRPPA